MERNNINLRKYIWSVVAIAVMFFPAFLFSFPNTANAANDLTASCSGTPATPMIGDLVTWNIVAAGGNGAYTYSIGGTDGLTGSTASVSKAYATAGQKNAIFIVTDGASHTVIDGCFVTVVTLATAQTNAHTALTNALATYTSTNYTTANWTTLNNFKTAGDTAIDAAITTAAITAAQNTATAGMAGVVADLAAARVVAHSVLTAALSTYTQSHYSPANWTTLNNFKTAGDTAIDAATTTAGVTSAQNTATTGMASVSVLSFTVTYTAGANGSITGSSTQTVSYGNAGSAVTATPAFGYYFVNWSDATTTNPRTDANVVANISITANFVMVADAVLPTTPTITTASATGTVINLANVSWTDSSDAETGVAGYLYSWTVASSTQISSSTDAGVFFTTATSTSTSTPGALWFNVAAIDNAGNISTTTNYGVFLISDSQVLIINSTIAGVYYDFYSPTLAQALAASTTGTTTILNSTIASTSVNNSDLDTVNASANSVIDNSNIVRCLIINSTVIDFTGSDCTIVNSFIDPSHGDFATSTSSTIINSTFDYSTIDHSYVATSSIINSNFSYSTSTNSTISTSTISYSVIDNGVVSLSTVDNSNIIDSTTTGSTVASSTIDNGSVVTGSTVILSDISNVSFINSTSTGSSINDSTVNASTLTNSTSTNSVIDSSTISNSTIASSTIDTGSVIGTSTVTLSDITNSDITGSTVTNSTSTNSVITDSVVDNSTLTNSTSTDSYIATSTIIDSTLNNSTSTNSSIDTSLITNSIIDNSTSTNSTISTSTIDGGSVISTSTITLSDITNTLVSSSTVTNSTTTDSVIDGSTVIDSTLTNSTSTNSYIASTTITDSIITNSTTTGSTIASSTLTNSTTTDSVIASSTLTNTVVSSSTITDSTIDGVTLINAVVINNIISTGTITINGTTTVISTSTPIVVLLDATPTAAFNVSTSSLQVTLTDTTTDIDEGTAFADSWTYDWDFGDGATSTISATTTEGSTSHTYVAGGSYTISLTVTDAYGKNSFASTSVTLVAPPVLTAISILPLNPSVTVGSTTQFSASTTDQFGADFATTTTWSSDTLAVGSIDAAGLFTASSTGTTTITATAGALSTSTVVTVTAVPVAPVLTAISILPLNPSVTVGSTTQFSASTTDQFGADFATTTTWSSDTLAVGSIDAAGLFTASSTGTTTITATAGALSTSTVVTVTATSTPDTTDPVITILGSNPVTLVAGNDYTDAGATATDNIDGDITSSIITTNTISSTTPVGAYTVTYTVSDAALNSTSTTRTVNVVATADVTVPVITISGSNPVNIVSGLVYTDAGATATDDVDGDITLNIITTGLPVDTSATGTQSIVYTVTDGAGNTASSTRTVNVISAPVDIVPPVITITGGTPTTVYASSTYSDAGATATDNIDGAVSVTELSNDVDTNITGSYSVVYSASDAAGNTSTTTRTVIVIPSLADVISPVIFITGGTPTTVIASSTYVDQGATATDDVDGDVTASIVPVSTVDTNVIGVYTVTYTATDSVLNSSTAIRTVNVVEATSTDIIPPAITINGGTPVTVYENSVYSDAGATATDDVDGDVTASIIPSGVVDTSIIGIYTITYTVSDVALNTATADREVIVIAAPADVIPPSIFITGGTPITVLASSTYTDAGATAIDNIDGAIAATEISNNVNTNIIGTYYVVYSATDAAANTSTTSRQVNVIAQDHSAPVITILGSNPVTLLETMSYTDAGATALDNFDGDITSTIATSSDVDTNTVGVYAVVYTSTDSSGNVASSTRTVNVIADSVAPVITILGNNPESIVIGNVYSDAGATANDNLDGDVTGSINTTNAVNTAIVGAYSVTYVVSDAHGNTATSTRTVNVTLAPVVITSLSISPLTPSVTAGATTTFTSTVLDQYSNVFATTTIWSSDTLAVGSIDAGGIFTAISLGTTTITATAGALSTTTIITVTAASVPGHGGGRHYAVSDINEDGVTDIYDFSIMMSQWGSVGPNLSADLNRDGIVDEYDFSLLMAKWD